ncbi:DUF2586 family protein [Flavobacterium gilvum]|uniref:Uncharacterized protein n=1 Tax=Flavobacterium gilvum TaxID=1492737 RepID=A0AAC9N5S4_9FLAO|nr:DUF2586 family protein [Flavobacterium gilvum]AOW08744.1 hypothetical protein EM308_04085 [Flavobacterium gilvum]KFC59815.1 hypothetical protein FEM08_13260 [Flavobacterium gilvum]
MGKPHVNIAFENGNIGTVTTSPDGVNVIVSSAVANAGFALSTPYTVYSLNEAEALGIIPTIAGNYELHKTIKEFYAEAGNGMELWIYGLAKTKTLDELVAASETVLTSSNRRIRFVTIKYAPSVPDTDVEAGLREGFPATCAAAQAIAEQFTVDNTHPVVFILEAYNYSGVPADLIGFGDTTYNRVAVMIGDTEKRTGATASKGAAVGVLAGRIAKNQVHVNVGRVKDGALKPLTFYVVDIPVEQVNVGALYDKGFITLTTHIGKSGYYFVDDMLACELEDDYHFLTRRRVIDKAYVLANQTLTNFILDTVPLTNEGKIQAAYAKALEAEVERVIAQEMTAKGELSADVTVANDTGVNCVIDVTNNIAQDSTIKGRIGVRPHGYGRFLEFTIGFNTGQ